MIKRRTMTVDEAAQALGISPQRGLRGHPPERDPRNQDW